ncbi:hypothetical protein [Gramella sp. AN32]|uniref:CHRD domain-containing protein n=1 Tax=Christiangramia antarctica TaxID=2058158 RepID=A0ABW5X3B9_9FLAO|nr:hypothetical protein [Gramella sp. AN32]MCM4157149.1 hypothetical protein [Gramella sp. AN32]
MKRTNFLLTIFAAISLLFTSCSKEEESSSQDPAGTETATLEFGALLNNLANRAASDSKLHFNTIPDCSSEMPAMAEITFSVNGGTSKTIEVEILNDGSSYYTAYTEDLKISTTGGNAVITLEGFIVYDAGDNMIWIAPSEEGDPGLFDGYVNKALPFDTTVYSGTKPYIDVEVLCFDRRMANEYGYVFFDIDQKEIFNFCIFGNFCTPSGRHYVANYSVDVWTYVNGAKDVQIYNDLTSTAVLENGIYKESPLCVALPDDPDSEDDAYYFEITLLDSPEYDAGNDEGRIVRAGVLTETEAKSLFVGEDRLEYYHFQVGDACDDSDNPPVFNDPEDDKKTYKACLRSLPEGKSDVSGLKANGYAYINLEGNQLRTRIFAFDMTPNKMHAQHIHGDGVADASCPTLEDDADADGFIQLSEGASDYGGVYLPLTLNNGDFPTADGDGYYNYDRTFTLGSGGNPSVSDIGPLDLTAVVLHGFQYGGSYLGSLPVACGELEEN